MTFQEAKDLLNTCQRTELRDHAFGDREVYWYKDEEVVADGYFGGTGVSMVDIIDGGTFQGKEARELALCGTLAEVKRNDSTGPDDYEDGKIMPGLTLEDVRKELEGDK